MSDTGATPGYGAGHRVCVAAAGYLPASVLGLAFGDGSSAFLAGVAGAIAGWFAAPAVCAKLGIKPSAPASAGARYSGLAITGFVFALLGFLLLPGLSSSRWSWATSLTSKPDTRRRRRDSLSLPGSSATSASCWHGHATQGRSDSRLRCPRGVGVPSRRSGRPRLAESGGLSRSFGHRAAPRVRSSPDSPDKPCRRRCSASFQRREVLGMSGAVRGLRLVRGLTVPPGLTRKLGSAAGANVNGVALCSAGGRS